jgi:glutamyl/glutaminyl-tRNA synthetase
MKTRIAPTPSGYLHAGNGAAFMLAWRLAQEAGGKLLLRIDDLDAERVRPEYLLDIFATLDWLGVVPDEGPRNAQELQAKWSQRFRLAEAEALLGALRTAGVLYGCDCSRKQVLERSGPDGYDGACRQKNKDLDGPGMAWRLRLPDPLVVHMRTWPDGAVQHHRVRVPDPVVRQRNGGPAYQVASLADDLNFAVDTLVRGMDLLPSSLAQLHMAEVLGRRSFREASFMHHPLLVGPNGSKLSKSEGAPSLRRWRMDGGTADAVRRLADKLRVADTSVVFKGFAHC